MSFVYPQFLWALLVISIPIIVHLFNFRRIKKVYFTNVRFLKAVKTETNSIRTIKELLILLSRILFLACLVLAFAQPFLPSKNQDKIFDANSVVSIYMDNSYSMQNELDNKKYFDWATESITDLLQVFPKSANFQLISNNFENKEQFASNASKIEDRLTEVQFSNKFRNLPTVHNRQINLLKRVSNDAKNQIFWFSDFQKSTAGNLDNIPLDSLSQYYLIPLKAEKSSNIAMDSLWLSNPFIKENETNTINFLAHNYGEETYEDLVLKLFIDDIQVSTATISLTPNAQASGTFNFTIQGKGLKKCKIVFEDFPIVFDNEFYFVMNVAPTINILHIYQEQTNNFIQSVFASEASFKTVHSSIKNLDYSLINTSDLVILNEPDNIDGELRNQLQKFVDKGGSLVIFASAKPGLSGYGSFLSSFGIRGIQAAKNDSLGKSPAKTLQLPNINQPFFKGIFEKIPSNMYMPYANPSFFWIPSGYTLLQFKNGHPFLSQVNSGKGKVYLTASPIDKKYSDFALNAIFVPIMYKIAALSKQQGEKLSYTFQDKNIILKVAENPQNQTYKLKKGEVEFIPVQRQVGEQLFLELPEDALEAGYYDLILNNQTVGILAFNYGKEESQMEFYTTEELKKAFSNHKNVQVYENITNQNFISDFKERNIGVSLWKYAIIGALIFLLIEILLIRLIKS